MNSPAGYKPIGTDKARDILEAHDKDILVILGWDEASGLIHTTTYGREAKHKEWAAQAGIIATEALGGDRGLAKHFEDFHADMDPARFKEAIDILQAVFRRQGTTPEIIQQIERFLKTVGRGVRG
jgi:hypothetical protein